MRVLRFVPVLLLLGSLGCQRVPSHLQPKDDLADVSWTLVDQDSQAVTFPDDFRGTPALVGYVYTFCPDVCPATTANMKRVRDAVEAAAGAGTTPLQLVSISFDPTRDTPAVLKRYAEAWQVDGTDWRFLTGDSTTVADLMNRMGVRVAIEPPEPPPVSRSDLAASDTTAPGPAADFYFINHTDQVSLLDEQGRVVGVYGGSVTPTEILVEDVRALR
ncbi:MAG: SCO family protein [Bacteroidota bacterium]